jgi:spore coat protein CotF
MGQKTEFAVANLQNAAYVVKSDQPQHHLNEANNVEVVIPDSDVLMGFKVFLMDEKDIQQRSIISEFFDKHSVSSEKSETFSVYAFKSENLEFTTSLFAQKEFLRLNFELKSSH